MLDGAQGIAAVALAVIGVLTVGATSRAMLDGGDGAASFGTIVTLGGHLQTGDTWTERLTDPSFWQSGEYIGGGPTTRSKQVELASPKSNPKSDEDDDEPRAYNNGVPRGTYRTVCVRLCDGYFFPISFATTPDRFARDAAVCQSSCRASARLYVYSNPGGEPEQMVDLEGQPYSELKSAFVFRTNYKASCTCKPHTWEREALDRHRAYAEAQRPDDADHPDETEQTRIVARTIRTEVQPSYKVQGAGRTTSASTEDRRNARRRRPAGAMLLGSDRPQKRARPAPERRSRTATRSGGASSSRDDWRQRAFSGN